MPALNSEQHVAKLADRLRRRVWPLLIAGLCVTPVRADDAVTDFVTKHCVTCHQGADAEAGLDLSSTARTLDDAEVFRHWTQVHRRAERLEMPPFDAPQPTAAERTAFVSALRQELIAADARRIATDGRAPLRRLNRTEFQNLLREVLALPHLDVMEMLPPDGSAHGFDKSSSALDFSHVHVTEWLRAIDAALEAALAPTAEPPQSRIIRASFAGVAATQSACQGFYSQLRQGRAIPMLGAKADDTVETTRGDFAQQDAGSITDPPPHFDGVALFINGASNLGMALREFDVTVPGHYTLRVHGFGIHNRRGRITPSDRLETVGFYTDDRTLGYCDLPSDRPTTAEITVWLNPGERVIPLVASSTYPIIRVGKSEAGGWKAGTGYGVVFQWIEIEGPLVADWPPESHRRLFGELPLRTANPDPPPPTAANQRQRRLPTRPQRNTVPEPPEVVSADPAGDAERLIRAFAERAIPRRLPADEVREYVDMALQKLAQGVPFQTALQAAYRGVLASPAVVLREERLGRLDQYQLAARLSYWLWAAPPDDELRRLAEADALTGDELARQVDRLLDDSRSQQFTRHFLDHWLALKDIDLTQPDENLYPEYNPLLLDAMLGETRAYFAELVRHDLGVSHLVASDFTYANQRLAELYGLPGVAGNDLRRVTLPAGLHRGGLLTQAALLKVTANGTTTSPVTRGVFVMSQLLGDPPPPPPPVVPAVEPDISGATTIREQLAAHRSVDECAGCHAKIDPPGFALESFDVMGAFRTRYRSVEQGDEIPGLLIQGGKPAGVKAALPVDCTGTLSGESFQNIDEFRGLLLRTRQRQMADNLLQRFIVYATGAPVGYADEAEFQRLLDGLESGGYGLRSMLHAVAGSEMFQSK